MALVSSFLVNDVSPKGINAAAGPQNTNVPYGVTLAGPFPSYQAAYNVLATTQAANPGSACRIVRFDISDGGAQNYCLLAPGF